MTDLPFLFDPGPVAALQQLLGLGWPGPWRVITLLGSNWGILLVVGFGLWLWGRRVAYSLLAVMAVDGLLKTALNSVFSVSRPDAGEIVKYENVGVGSFPSGHVSTATALWGWLAAKGRISWLLAITVVLLESISRLYLGVHFVGDVLGGIALAAVTIALVYWLWPPLEEWLSQRSFLFFAGMAVLALALVIAGTFFFFGTNPYRWRAGGLVAGLAIALPLEYRFVRYDPGRLTAGRTAAMIGIGLAGLAAIATIDLMTGERATSLGFTATALAGIWTMLVAPTLFAVWGWAWKEEDPRREQTVRRTGRWMAVAAGALAAIIVYGGAIEPRFILDTKEVQAEVPGLPSAWEGETVAVVSDFQVGLWLDNTGMMRRAINEIVDRNPSVAILAGDFIYEAGSNPRPVISHMMDILGPLVESGIPTFAVLGNHDWGLAKPIPESQPNREAARMLRDTLEAVGITVLHNRSARVQTSAADAVGAAGAAGADTLGADTLDGNTLDAAASDASLYLVGVGSRYAEMDDPTAALADVPSGAARIAIMHNPQSFPDFPAESAPLAVAGHTHGGQVRIPFTPEWSYLTFTGQDNVHADGWIEEDFGEAGNRLYVTRGIGMSLVPMRLNCPPEVTYFILSRGTQTGS